jgi:adenylyl-sulfate kinase
MNRTNSNDCGVVLWFTGLSGVGKTTVANCLKERLVRRNLSVSILDGDQVRANRQSKLGYSAAEIKENNNLVVDLCVEKRCKFDVTISAIISPFRSSREKARKKLSPRFFEIYLFASVEHLRERDVKGLYAREASGDVTNLIGISRGSPYEVPKNPDLVFNTETASLAKVVSSIYKLVGREIPKKFN